MSIYMPLDRLIFNGQGEEDQQPFNINRMMIKVMMKMKFYHVNLMLRNIYCLLSQNID